MSSGLAATGLRPVDAHTVWAPDPVLVPKLPRIGAQSALIAPSRKRGIARKH
jgi:hypothetical protein